MSMFRKTIQYGGITLEYSGSDSVVERVNSSLPLRKDLIVEVLTVGSLYPPQVHYRYVISKTTPDSYKWKSLPRWSHCDRICKGKQHSTPVCIHESTRLEVDEDLCSYLGPKPEVKSKDCNMHCELTWRLKSQSSCSAKCGKGTQRVSYDCVRIMSNQQEVNLAEQYCLHDSNLKRPSDVIDCEGPCEGVRWVYSQWTPCSESCGGGMQTREAACVDSDNVAQPDDKCFAIKAVTEQECSQDPCPKWMTGEWTAVSTVELRNNLK